MRTKKTTIRCYSELIEIPTFQERFEYLILEGIVGDPTFGGHRYLNQVLYSSPEWRRARMEVILRDGGCDLAHEDYPIGGRIYVHHINPITMEDILNRKSCLFDLENLVSVSFDTHNALHYGDEKQPFNIFTERQPNDTCPWR